MLNKKKSALAALFAVCMMAVTACGPIDDETAESVEKITETSYTAETSESAEQTTEVSETDISEAGTDVSTDESSSSAGSENYDEDSWEYAVMNYFENINSKDIKKIMNMMYPSDLVERMENSGRLDGLEDELFSDESTDVNTENIRLTKLNEITDEALNMFMDQLDQTAAAQDLLESYGNDIDAVPEEEINKIISNLYEPDTEPNAEHIYNVTDVLEVKAEYLKNGEPYYDYFYLYNIEGDGWKVQQSMRKWVENANKNSVKSSAKSAFTNIVTVLYEMEREGVLFPETFIISSEEDKMINVPEEFNMSRIPDDMFISERYHYFAALKNNDCSVLICWSISDDGDVTCGAYPPDEIDLNGKTIDMTDVSDKTPEELFDEIKTALDLQ